MFGVEDDQGLKHAVHVPPGMLQDIVRPYWGERVQVTAVKKRNSFEFPLSSLNCNL